MSRRYKQLEDNRLEHRVIMEDALGFKLPKEFIVTMMVQAVVNVQSKYGEEAAMKELMGMMTEAAQQYCEATKEDEKCEVLN